MKKIIAIFSILLITIVILVACKDANNLTNNHSQRNTDIENIPENKKYYNGASIDDLFNKVQKQTGLDETYIMTEKELDAKYNFLNLIVTDCQVRAGYINDKYTELAFFKMGSKDQNVEAFKFVSTRKSNLKETLKGFKDEFFLFQQDSGLITIVYSENASEILKEVGKYLNGVS